MGSDLHLQDQQDEFDEWQRQQKALEAAVPVVDDAAVPQPSRP